MQKIYTITVEAPSLTELEQKVQQLAEQSHDVCFHCDIDPEHVSYNQNHVSIDVIFGQIADIDPLA
ncbi:MAG: hypothetical protein ACRDAO_03890 [Culicoidibacterales bacterium]